MGLDMYLTARKQIYTWGNSDEDNKNGLQISSILDIAGLSNVKSDVLSVSFQAMYWRKANAIHKWFVDNVQDGKDDCGEYELTIYQLDDLLKVCRQVLQDPDNAHKYLPTTDGFFYGSTSYDKFYFSDVENTVSALARLLSNRNVEQFSFFYSSSW